MSEEAAKAGATHVIISDMPRSRWMWERDLSDPYTNWSMGQCQIFKLVCPPELEKYLPVEHIRECFELVRERCEILKKHGLKPALFSNEPFWLPEEVYREHPDWREQDATHPRRARKPYYSPSIDNPEVLEMYRKAVESWWMPRGLILFILKQMTAVAEFPGVRELIPDPTDLRNIRTGVWQTESAAF